MPDRPLYYIRLRPKGAPSWYYLTVRFTKTLLRAGGGRFDRATANTLMADWRGGDIERQYEFTMERCPKPKPGGTA
jgi:hypothetical protein